VRERGASPQVIRRAREQRDGWRRTQAASVFAGVSLAALGAPASAAIVTFGACLIFLSQLRVIGIERLIEDPPRLDFTTPTEAIPPIHFEDVFDLHPMERATVEISKAGLSSVALAEAVVVAFEREQGALIAGAMRSAYARRQELASFVRQLYVAENSFAEVADGAAAALAELREWDVSEPPWRGPASNIFSTSGDTFFTYVHDYAGSLETVGQAGIPLEALDVPFNKVELASLLNVAVLETHNPLFLLSRELKGVGNLGVRFGASLSTDQTLWV
jgi:hypothetical protein